MAENIQEWLGIVRNDWEVLGMAGKLYKWLKLSRIALTCQEWLGIIRIGLVFSRIYTNARKVGGMQRNFHEWMGTWCRV